MERRRRPLGAGRAVPARPLDKLHARCRTGQAFTHPSQEAMRSRRPTGSAEPGCWRPFRLRHRCLVSQARPLDRSSPPGNGRPLPPMLLERVNDRVRMVTYLDRGFVLVRHRAPPLRQPQGAEPAISVISRLRDAKWAERLSPAAGLRSGIRAVRARLAGPADRVFRHDLSPAPAAMRSAQPI